MAWGGIKTWVSSDIIADPAAELNRLEGNCAAVYDILKTRKSLSAQTHKTDWTMAAEITLARAKNIEDNIKAFFTACEMSFTASDWTKIVFANYSLLNYWENMLLAMYTYAPDLPEMVDRVDYLICAGGGGGGSTTGGTVIAGGGGGGGVIYKTMQGLTTGAYAVLVGNGGAPNANGQDSFFNGETAVGGGAGGHLIGSAPWVVDALSGGCGGGACVTLSGAAGTSGQGYAGGDGGLNQDNQGCGGGGGGAGGAGQAGQGYVTGGNGGDAFASDITGSTQYYGGGGGGSAFSYYGTPTPTPGAGSGGGGNGGVFKVGGVAVNGTNGSANSGGGGGGQSHTDSAMSGGSGIVVIRYKTSGVGECAGGTKTTDGDYTVHTFTSNGTFYFVEKDETVPDVDAYTKSLIHMDGADNGTTFTDEKSKTITRAGNTCTKQATKKFGQTSAYFDGSGDYLSLESSADWAFGTGDFTVEMWINVTAWGDANPILWASGTNGGFQFGKQESSTNWGSCNWGIAWGALSSTLPTTGTWHHVAAVRASGVMNIYLDGTRVATGEDTNDYVAGTVYIGYNNYSGYIDELRVSKGIARWTGASFTAPTAPYTVY